MRTWWLISLLAACAALSPAHSAARADDAPPVLEKQDKLTPEDPKDEVMKNSYAKSYSVKFDAGKIYRIDMTSKEVDSFLRLLNPDGNEVASDNDSGGKRNARIVHQVDQAGDYKIIATTFGQPTGPFKLTGAFMLTVNLAGAGDLLEARTKGIAAASITERDAIINELKKHLQDLGPKVSEREVAPAMNVARYLEIAAPKQAVEVYKDYAKLFAASQDQRIAGIARTFEGSARRIALLGNSMELKGTTLDGKEIDLAKLKGKVVLVDFWATWCGPCVAEIPNMKKMYEAYNGRGFEILAVSVDQGKDAPTKFIAERKLPWPCIHDDRAGGKSLSDRYGVMAIPLPILVDREGKVVSMNARGPELERLLEKHIGPLEKATN
jgi:thiol-disulfide isomerase/thioredoxin